MNKGRTQKAPDQTVQTRMYKAWLLSLCESEKQSLLKPISLRNKWNKNTFIYPQKTEITIMAD